MLGRHEVLLFSENREKLVQALKSLLDYRLVVKNWSRAGLQGGHQADNGDRKTKKLHVAIACRLLYFEFGGVAECVNRSICDACAVILTTFIISFLWAPNWDSCRKCDHTHQLLARAAAKSILTLKVVHAITTEGGTWECRFS